MDGTALPISSLELYARLGTAASPLVLDVRHDDAFKTDGLIIGAIHRSSGDEHAYHMDYGAAAARYIDTYMEAIRWDNAAKLYDQYRSQG